MYKICKEGKIKLSLIKAVDEILISHGIAGPNVTSVENINLTLQTNLKRVSVSLPTALSQGVLSEGKATASSTGERCSAFENNPLINSNRSSVTFDLTSISVQRDLFPSEFNFTSNLQHEFKSVNIQEQFQIEQQIEKQILEEKQKVEIKDYFEKEFDGRLKQMEIYIKSDKNAEQSLVNAINKCLPSSGFSSNWNVIYQGWRIIKEYKMDKENIPQNMTKKSMFKLEVLFCRDIFSIFDSREEVKVGNYILEEEMMVLTENNTVINGKRYKKKDAVENGNKDFFAMKKSNKKRKVALNRPFENKQVIGSKSQLEEFALAVEISNNLTKGSIGVYQHSTEKSIQAAGFVKSCELKGKGETQK